MTTDSVAVLSETDLGSVNVYWRAANYLSVGQIYLLGNPLLREPLRPEHIKPRLLGHWGTTPGLNLIYAHMNRLIRAHDLEAISHKLADVAHWPPIEAPERIANLVLTTAPVGGGWPA